ncbi:hypothetical protein ACFZDJ_25590 [Streptomyces sp. NPDC007896]|uniref:hypothetical protein n=1 Tax=unclassified Streptomyces TaxID=2593676 RepID=UPI0036EDD536
MTAADRWIGALHDSSKRLGHAVADLPPDRLGEASFAEGWSIGQAPICRSRHRPQRSLRSATPRRP